MVDVWFLNIKICVCKVATMWYAVIYIPFLDTRTLQCIWSKLITESHILNESIFWMILIFWDDWPTRRSIYQENMHYKPGLNKIKIIFQGASWRCLVCVFKSSIEGFQEHCSIFKSTGLSSSIILRLYFYVVQFTVSIVLRAHVS